MDHKAPWQKLEHSIYQKLSSFSLESKKLLVGFSGGLDSVALLLILKSLGSALKIDLVAVHIHHGGASNYRDQALKFCSDFCEKNNVEFVSQKSEQELISEESLRDFRYQILREEKQKAGADFIVTAHHADDLLETRFLRLLRGTGIRGLQAMKLLEAEILRPLLEVQKEELKDFVLKRNETWLEDPSNQDLGPMRNWLRNSWLPALDAKAPGAIKAFARSLELILEQASFESFPEELWSDKEGMRSISKPVFLGMTEKQQKNALAQYLLFLGQVQFTQNHILEVLKQLDKTQNEHMFIVAQCEWCIDAKQILAYPVVAAR